MLGQIVIVSGPPGAGKSTIARRLADEAQSPLAIHLHTDDFYAYVRKGFIEPWKPQAREQNAIILDALAAASAIYAKAGYDVIADGIVGPWFFDPWLAAARKGQLDLRYIILLPDEHAITKRVVTRENHPMKDPATARFMHGQFTGLDAVRDHMLDTTNLTTDETVEALKSGLASGRYKLPL